MRRLAPSIGLATTYMNAEHLVPSFVDTNILVYAFAPDDPSRSPIAQDLVEGLIAARSFHTSTQVLQELYITLTRKLRVRLDSATALDYVDQIAESPVVNIDYRLIREAIRLSEAHNFSFWDSLIVIAASRAQVRRLYTEDLQDRRVILGVEIVNPFRQQRPTNKQSSL